MVARRWLILVWILCLQTMGVFSEMQLSADGKVLELDDSTFESVISSFDFVFVDFYAPWCSHCKHLSPELDLAAPILAGLKQPVVIAKVNADKFARLASTYEIDGFPTLKIFMHGVPVDYYGPRKADLLVRYLKKFVAADVTILGSDIAISDFVEDAGTYFPIFIGFSINETVISNLASKYKKKAWFAMAKDVSEDIMIRYDFAKVPALVSLLPSYNEQSVFYGPFEEEFLEEFIKQNFLPLAVPINHETLNILKDDKRKIVLTIVEDEVEEKTQKLIKLLKAAASANHDLVFGYVGVKQWDEFSSTFGVNKESRLPKMIVWSGNEEYITVNGSESIDGDDVGSEISRFLEGYREGRIQVKGVSGPSVFGYINSLIGIRTIYIIVFLVVILMVIRSIKDEDDEPSRSNDDATSSAADMTEYKPGDKED